MDSTGWAPFEAHPARYDDWFERHEAAYRSEVAALEALLPDPGFALEIGVGTGRFAGPLGLDVGIDPAPAMLARARDRGVTPICGVAERLPFRADAFDVAVIVTTICFVTDVHRTLAEARRVLGAEGDLVIGYVDRESPLGRRYRARSPTNPFYRDATFVSTEALIESLESAGFGAVDFTQTLFAPPEELEGPDRVEPGHGEGSFVALRAAT